MTRQSKAALLMGAFVFLWAAVEMLGGYAGVPGPEVVWFRYGTHLVAMLILFGPRCRGAIVRTKCPLHLHVVRSLMMLGMPLAYLEGAARVPQSDVLSVFWSYPVLLVAASHAAARYNARPRDYVLTASSFAAALLILLPLGEISYRTAVFPLAMAACFIAYMLMTRSMLRESTITNLLHTALWVFAALTLYVPFVWRTPSVRGLLAMAAIGMLGLAGLYALDKAIHLAAPAEFATAGYLQIVFVVLLDATVHGRPVTIAQTIGATLIGAAVIAALAARPDRKALGAAA